MDDKCSKEFPFKIEVVKFEEDHELINCLPGYGVEFLHVGPKKYFVQPRYSVEAANIYNFPVRSDDTFVVTYPKSGTTLTQELVWLICNNLDYEKAQLNLNGRFPFLEMLTITPPVAEAQLETIKKLITLKTVKDIEDMPSPRFIKSHLPFSLLPPSLLDTAKVVYVIRDPRDVAVSFYHHHKMAKAMKPDQEFKPFWKNFVSDYTLWGPYFEHVLEALEKRDHPNLLFLSYEEMTKDLSRAIRRVAIFFGKTLTEEQVNGLVDHLRIDNFKKNKSVNLEDLQEIGVLSNSESFIRKGKSGGWRDYFDEEMAAQAEEWMAKNLIDTDFRFLDC